MEKKWLRIYVNNFSNPDTLWSVDEGTVETERNYIKVICQVSTATGIDLTAPPETHPRAWLSAKGYLSEVTDKTGRKVAVITG